MLCMEAAEVIHILNCQNLTCMQIFAQIRLISGDSSFCSHSIEQLNIAYTSRSLTWQYSTVYIVT